MDSRIREMRRVQKRLRNTFNMMMHSDVAYREFGTRAMLVANAIDLAMDLAESLAHDMGDENGAE